MIVARPTTTDRSRRSQRFTESRCCAILCARNRGGRTLSGIYATVPCVKLGRFRRMEQINTRRCPHLVVTSRWLPPLLALVQTVRHVWMIAYTYWTAAQTDSRFDVGQFIRRDLARPLFEPYPFCGAWTHYLSAQSAALGLDLPAYAAATLLHSAMTWQISCLDAIMTPRGHILSAAFVLPLWFLVGLSIRRFAQRRWHRRVEGRIKRTLIVFGLIPLPLGLLALIFSVVGLFFSDIGLSVRLAGIAFWAVYVSALAAERLRFWPFDGAQLRAQPGATG